MSGGRDSEAEFQQFFKSLIQPKAPIEGTPSFPFGVRDVIVNGPLRCKIYIGISPAAERKPTSDS